MENLKTIVMKQNLKYLLLFLIYLYLGSTVLNAQSSNRNYIHARTMLNEEGTQYIDNIQYFDGLGRPVQTVQKGITPNGADLVTRQEYDAFGRDSASWLPVIVAGNNGAFLPQLAFKSKVATTYPGETKPYAKPVYENSPLNRVLEQYGPGERWHNNAKAVRAEYLTNAESGVLSCKLYKTSSQRDVNGISIESKGVALSFGGIVLTSGGRTLTTGGGKAVCYNPCELYVTKLTDEDGNDSYEFKDKLGQVVLTRQMDGELMHDTYYVYDDFGNLRAVLPPLAADSINSGSNLNEDNPILDRYAYLYKYDYRNRCIEKKLPGCEPVRYKYDKADKLIFSQDGEMREKGVWMFSVPDAFGRPTITGTTTQAPDVSNMVVKASRSDRVGNLKGYTLSDNSILAGIEIHSVNYYDDYSFRGNYGIPQSDDTDFEELADYGGWYSTSQKGLLTGTLTAQFTENVVSDEYLYTIMYYDERGRVTQTKSNNHLGGMEKEYTAYNFTGQPTKRRMVHSVNEQDSIVQVYDYNYDHAGRLETVLHQLNEKEQVLLAKNEYDELGRLQTNKLHVNQDSVASQLDYSYNIRNWLTHIESEPFTQQLYYNEGMGDKGLYNGNIQQMKWKNQNGDDQYYLFEYDGLNRLLGGEYMRYIDETGMKIINRDTYSESFTYDKNGNIKTLKRKGIDVAGLHRDVLVDNLSISHVGNQMYAIKDPSYYMGAFFSPYNSSAGYDRQYIYNANGSLTQDFNKGIACVEYNLLNLPNVVQFVNGNRTDYLYDAAGVKRRVTHLTSKEYMEVAMGTTLNLAANQVDEEIITDYCGSVIYENEEVSKILTEQGYITFAGGDTHTYHYFIKDHLGSTRMVVDQSGGEVECNSYYPSGASIEGASTEKNSYKYNGKELDHKHRLDWYDYGARMYDPVTGVWSTMDPLAEKYYNISPYAYCANNPMMYVDPNGEEIVIFGDADYQKKILNLLYSLYKSGNAGAELVMNAIRSEETVVIANMEEDRPFYKKMKDYSLIGFNFEDSEGTYDEKDGGVKYSAETQMAHELGHFKSPSKGKQLAQNKKVSAGEVAAVEWENRVRKDLGMDVRKKYEGIDVYNKQIAKSENRNGYYETIPKKDYAGSISEPTTKIPSPIPESSISRVYYYAGRYLDRSLAKGRNYKQKLKL